MKYLMIADTHFGLQRVTGATAESVSALENDKLDYLIRLVNQHRLPVIILGDLLDKSDVSLGVLNAVGTVLKHLKVPVTVIAGNHDLSKDCNKISGFDFLKAWLPTVRFVTEVEELETGKGVFMLPHQTNQELFDQKLKICAGAGARCLLTHCNYENNFAVDKDHSLNMTKAQAGKFDTVITGHEHVAREVANVIIPGSFAPSTPSEALGDRHAMIFDSETLSCERVDYDAGCLTAAIEIDWTVLADVDNEDRKQLLNTQGGFISITGVATAAQASSVLTGIAAFRKKSQAYMIANAVQTGGLGLDGDEDSGSGLSCESAWDLFIKLIPKVQIQRLKDLGYAHN